MRSIVVILLILSSFAYGQRIPRTDDPIKKGDILEILYANESLFKIAEDTFPLYISDNNSDLSWRDWIREVQIIRYFYDTSNVLKKISFKNGGKGTYFFYFEGAYLRKARILKHGGLINKQYYFTNKDNMFSISWVDQIPTQDPDRKDFYELLIMGKTFFDKFKPLL